MAKDDGKSVYKQRFIQRVRSARIGRDLKQDQIAVALGTDQATYKQYESRSLLPHNYVEKFCIACGIEPGWLFTGKGRGPTILEMPVPRRKRAATKRKAKAA